MSTPRPLRWKRLSDYGGWYGTTNGQWQIEHIPDAPRDANAWVLSGHTGGGNYVPVGNYRTKVEAQDSAQRRADATTNPEETPA